MKFTKNKISKLVLSAFAFIVLGFVFTAAVSTENVEATGGAIAASAIVLYSYTSVVKSDNPMAGAGGQKNAQITIFRWDDVDVGNFPSRIDGVKITDNIPFLSGKNMINVDVKRKGIYYKGDPEGESGSKAIIQELYGEYAGYTEEIAKFIENNRNEDLGAILDFCDDSRTPLLFGTPCAPLELMDAVEDNDEKAMTAITLKSQNKGPGIAFYTGTKTLASANTVAADTTIVNVASGSGRYELTDNTGATAITGFSNATAGMKITLVGSGGDNPATIDSSSTMWLTGDVQWVGLAGKEITFEIFDATRAVEISRK